MATREDAESLNVDEAIHYTADEALRRYKYWADVAHEAATSPGRDSESYRAAAEMSHRWLGRYDVLSAWERQQEAAEVYEPY